MGLLLYSTEGSFQKVLNQLWCTSVPNKSVFQESVLEEATALLNEPNGLVKLFKYAHLFDEAGVFAGKPWENLRNLNPSLVRGTLHAGGIMATAEILSNLRILAIARGDYEHPDMSPYDANEFLTKVMALNLDLLLMKETEENRVNQLYKDKQASEILEFISEHRFSPLVFRSLYQEVENLAVQRPIVTNKILKLIDSAKRLAGGLEESDSSLMQYENAVYSPSKLATTGLDRYEKKLKISDEELLIREAKQLRASMNQTGLVSEFHVLFLNYINEEKPDLLKHLLVLDKTANENLSINPSVISSLITSSITVQTKNSIYSLMRLLQRGIFSDEFVDEIKKLVNVPIHENIKNTLTTVYKITDTDGLRALIVSGIINVLGQPLGLGQGFNPTCQSTRALSYWSQKEPVMLLKMYIHFLEQEEITMEFEGKTIFSNTLPHVPLFDQENIDTVSVLLLSHLDALYFDMLQTAKEREQDSHKWINPAFHIKGVWTEFSDVYSDPDFRARFYWHYHPTDNPTVNEGLPQPAGITIYNQSGQILGAHAVLIQRVAYDPGGSLRVYFYNPNNDSLQLWGNNIRTSVFGNGEYEGESSLLFDDFLYFLYAFHYPKQD